MVNRKHLSSFEKKIVLMKEGRAQKNLLAGLSKGLRIERDKLM